MSARNLLTGRNVPRVVTTASITGAPKLENLTQLDAVQPSSRLKLIVTFELRDPRARYVTGCPVVDRATEALGGNPTILNLEARRWERRPKFNHILDLTLPTLVVVTTQGLREVGKTREIQVLSAQIDLGRNPVIWLRW